MVDQKMCRICMASENLTSVFSIMDGGRISEKINFVCGLTISSADAFPKLICHQCLSSIIIASSIKRKSLETDKVFQEVSLGADDELFEEFSDDDEPILVESNDTVKNKYLVYEEDSEMENQPKMNFSVSDTSAKINNLNHFNYNLELKSFVGNYIENKPNLEIVKVTDPQSIHEIERVIARNEGAKRLSQTMRQKVKLNSSNIQSSRLLNALSGRRNQVTLNRISSALNIVEGKRN